MSGGHLSDLGIDRLTTGELDAAAALAARAHLAMCAPCSSRYSSLLGDAVATRHDARFAEAVALAAQSQVDAGRGPRPRARPQVRASARWIVPAVLATVMVASLGLRQLRPETRVKGALAMDVFVRRAAGGAIETLLPDDPIHPGDQLRVRVAVPGPGFFGVFTIDPSSTVLGYLPAGNDLAAVRPGAAQLLDGAIELDATLGRERLLGVLCPAATAKSQVVAQIGTALASASGDPARLDPHATVPGCAVTWLGLRKVVGR